MGRGFYLGVMIWLGKGNATKVISAEEFEKLIAESLSQEQIELKFTSDHWWLEYSPNITVSVPF